MHYLIDGHNLIGKLPDIKLSDSDDEIRLILRLKAWVAGHRQRQVTVVFDAGITGGISHRLSTKEITVVFAPRDKTADDLLIKRLGRLRNPGNYTLVSSDNRIIDAARVARIKFLRSEEFIERMGFVFRETPPPTHKEPPPPTTPSQPEKSDDPQLSDAEVGEWLNLFGSVPKPAPKRKRGSYSVLRKQEKDAPEAEPQPEERRPLTPEEFAAMAESDNPELDDAEVAEWLALFGGEEKKKGKAERPSPTQSHSVRKKDPADKSRLTIIKDSRRKLSKEEVDEWLDLFGGRETSDQ
ncbi:MAG: NYN domain-containing protein [Ardenticatenaceae bacterium]|nr:NYN domain-containing protein [Ardenticatenaceae bacterium]MCB8990959.1 NYN domain-containing protein [Ardenticatenaceae bacterium]MCB9004390.1 NYN domain-containing protein [Ardenticatenaceae bacterium]